MSDRSQWTLFIVVATFIVVVLIAVLLVRLRAGLSAEIEGVRNQQSSHDDQVMAEHRHAREALRWIKTQLLKAIK